MFFFIALYLQLVLGDGIVRAGATLLPLTATIVLVAPLAGRLSDRIGRRAPIITGLLLLAVGLIVLSALRQRSGATLLISGLTLTGVGIGFTTSPSPPPRWTARPTRRPSRAPGCRTPPA